MHAMRGISAHSNGFHTCRALHLLQMVLGAVDTPGSFRYKAPFPRPAPPGPKPAGRPEHVAPNKPMPGPPLGFTKLVSPASGSRGYADIQAVATDEADVTDETDCPQ
jgi:anaerobic selenocysteine-containing dehydrogenase